jgi:hypothetical protein
VSYVENAIQATQFGFMGESYSGEGRPQVYRGLAPRDLVFQEPFKTTRRFAGPDVIEFIVNGKEGVCVLNALEENWTGFERWDDQSLFEGGRLQIILRLQVRLSVKVYH